MRDTTLVISEFEGKEEVTAHRADPLQALYSTVKSGEVESDVKLDMTIAGLLASRTRAAWGYDESPLDETAAQHRRTNV
ncbi:hypothetical protein BESB_040050 [Besnoitia besnoiti]|uniref:Uncharacterized protein n=1 Tax=Besnoitia besnoiti TaxID=94643 RepID=A0A2A9MNP7_BESBE|nr:hypothetical protein BESB_040050 [Besnoitia besnoiti]PFH37547.1 hypothetical protein BESB_040050 [Besnoitia besnoiti]